MRKLDLLASGHIEQEKGVQGCDVGLSRQRWGREKQDD
jgi:hypothetical protein